MSQQATTPAADSGPQASKQLVAAKHSLRDEFKIDVPPAAMIAGYEPGHYAVPPRDDGYVFQRPKLRDFLAFWESGLIALKLKGDPGTGKTSLPEQFHCRLQWPLYKVSCSDSTEILQLIGQLLPRLDGHGLRWHDGPIMRAAREGTTCLLDEYNMLNPSVSGGLNALLDGYAYEIPETGEIVKPKKGFRIIATENPVDSQLSVAGRNVQDVANDDRFMEMEVDYLPADLETQVVVNALTAAGTPAGVAELLAAQVVKVANETRAAYRSGNRVIDKPLSTRAAVRWAKLVRRFQKVSADEGGPVVYALRRAVPMSKDMGEAVAEFTKAAVGSA